MLIKTSKEQLLIRISKKDHGLTDVRIPNGNTNTKSIPLEVFAFLLFIYEKRYMQIPVK